MTEFFERRATIDRRTFLSKGALTFGSLLFAQLPVIARSLTQTGPDFKILKEAVKGQVLTEKDVEFETILFGELWNKIRPDRAPLVIVQVMDEEDISTAMKFARVNGLKIVVRGGGHNWSNSSVRQGGMLIDLSNLNQIESVDKANLKAVVQPIVGSAELMAQLNAQGLAFPTGHCPTVKMSGYLLSGGMAWNQGVWGCGSANVEAIDLVTASGERITANKSENADYFWAARGSGSGFFGIATKYHLKLHALPSYIASSTYFYSLQDMPKVAKWLGDLAPKLIPNVELSLFLMQAPKELAIQTKDQGSKICMLIAIAFAESDIDAKAALAPLNACPVIDHCLSKTVNEQVHFPKLFDMCNRLYPPDHRNQVQAQFSNASLEELFGSVVEHFKHAPSNESLIMFTLFAGPGGSPQPTEDMAFRTNAKLHGGVWTTWKDEKQDAANIAWHEQAVQFLKPFVDGYYLAEVDALAHPELVEKSFAPVSYKRLQELRGKCDPRGAFFSYSDGLD